MSSGASVSSFGSAVGDPEQARMPGGDDDPLEDGQTTFETLVLGLAYTVAKDKEDTPRWFVVIRLAAEFLQLWLLIINPDFGWQYDDRNKVFELVSILNLKDFMGARGYSFYLAVMYIMFIILLAVIAFSAYVGWSFQNNRLDSAWPVKLLRFFAATFCQVLDIAVLNLFLIALDCNYFDKTPLNGNREFPGAVPNCWVTPHLIHAGVAVVSLLIFIPVGMLDAMSRMELNPTSRSWLAMNHSKTEIIIFSLKAIVTAMCIFVTNYKWLCVGLGVCMLLLSLTFIRWVPYMHDWVNHARAASFTCVLFCAIVLTFSIYHPGIEWDDADGIRDYRQKTTDILWAGMAPAMFVGALFSYLRLRYYRVTVVGRFAHAKPGTKPKYIHKFTDVRQVEIAARCCRHWIDQDTLEPGKVTLAEQIIKAGLSELPKSTFMVVFHSSFLIEVQSSYQSGYTTLQAAKQNKPSLLERYAIFIREQQHTQKAGDVVSFVEMMRNYRMVHRVHKEALLATRAFWQALLHYNVSFLMLSQAVKRLDRAVHVAERVYRSVLQKNSSSVKLLRIYTKFLEHVKHDPWSAAKWAKEADRLHLIEEDRKNNIFTDLGGGAGAEDDDQPAWVQHMAAVEEGKAVIIMDAQCMIQAANQVAHNVFGYGKNELRGRNINILIPPPFAEHHDTYVKNYIQTGRGQILDKDSEFVALHKEKYVFAVNVHVTKVMGMGQDSIFMGILEAVPSLPNTATAWVLANGAMLSVDNVFTDMFGYRPEDLLGSYISALVPEHAKLNETMKEIKDENSRFQEQMEVQRAAQHQKRLQLALQDTATHRPPPPPPLHHGGGSQPSAAILALMSPGAGATPGHAAAPSHNTAISHTTTATHGTTTITHGTLTLSNNIVVITNNGSPVSKEVHMDVSNHGSDGPAPMTPSRFRMSGGGEQPASILRSPKGSPRGHHAQAGALSSQVAAGLEVAVSGTYTYPSAYTGARRNSTTDMEAVSTSDTGTLQKSWKLEGYHVRHKYADTLEVNLEVKNGGVGTHLFYVLQVQRPKEVQNNLMFVTDRQGRLQHVTQDLATALGRSVHSLCNSGNINALEALMPEPFGLLHRSLLATQLPTVVPPHSCRTGAAIMLQGQGIDGPVQMPFKIRAMRKKEDIKANTTQHVVALEQATLPEALDDRRLTLLVDVDGKISKVGNAAPHLFGFDPKQLLGRCITSVIDCLAPPEKAAANKGGTGMFTQPADDPQEVAHVILQLARRATAQPGVSWRVGVVQPLDPNLDMNSLGEIGRSMIAASQEVRPAVMAVAVHVPSKRRSSVVEALAGGAGGLYHAVSDAASLVPSLRSRGPSQEIPLIEGYDVPIIQTPAPQLKPSGNGPQPLSLTPVPVLSDSGAVLPADDMDYSTIVTAARPPGVGVASLGPAGPSTLTVGADGQQGHVSFQAVPGQIRTRQGSVVMDEAAAVRMVDEALQEGTGGNGLVVVPPVPEVPVLEQLISSSQEHQVAPSPQEALLARPPSSEKPPSQHQQWRMSRAGQQEQEQTDAVATVKPLPSARAADAKGGIMIEIHLWRADMLCGILEVEPSGKIVASNSHKLNPSGLVLGCPSDALVTRNVNSFLPVGPKVTALFDDPVKPGMKAQKSLLKGNKDKMDRVAGPPHTMTIMHAADQTEIELEVQIVRRAPPARTLYLLLHPVNPRCGRPDFREWLDTAGWESARGPLLPTLNPHHMAPSRVPSAHHQLPSHSRNASFGSPAHRSGSHQPQGSGAAVAARRSIDYVATQHSGALSPQPPALPHRMSYQGTGLGAGIIPMGMPSVAGPRAGGRISNNGLHSQDGMARALAPRMSATIPEDGPPTNRVSAAGSHASALEERLKEALGAANPNKDPLSRVAQWILTDGATYPQGGKEDGDGKDGKGRGASSSGATKQQQQGPNPSAFSVHVVAGPGTSNTTGSGDAANGPADGAGDVAPRTESGTAVWDKAAMARMPTQDSMAAGAARQGGSGHASARANTKGQGAGVLMSDDNGVPKLQLRAPDRDHGPEDGPDTMDEGQSSSEDDAFAEQDPQLIEAAAHLGDEAGAPEHNSEQLSDGEGGAGIGKSQGDFRRGVRLRKLYKRMNGAAFQKTLKQFKVHSLCLVLLLFVVHIGMFGFIYSLLLTQQQKVSDFSNTGKGAQTIAQIARLTTDIDIFLNNRTVPGLVGLDTPQDFADALDTIKQKIEILLTNHEGTYLGFKGVERIPEQAGLRTIWDSNGTTVRQFYDSRNDTSVKQKVVTVTQGLWQTGNEYANKALWVWQNWMIRANETETWGSWINWAPVQYILYNGVFVLLPAYYSSMDDLMTALVDQFHSLNTIQMTVMGAEAVGLCALVCFYMYILLNQVNNYRFSIYNTFLLIPVGMSRALAHKPLGLDDEDEDDDDTPAVGLLTGGNNGQQQGGDGDKNDKDAGKKDTDHALDLEGKSKDALGANRGLWTRITTVLGGGFVNVNAGGKRQLKTSRRMILWMLWPLALWGIILVGLYMAAYQSIDNMSAPLAMLNVVTFVSIRFTRTFYFAQALAWQSDLAAMATARATLNSSVAAFVTEYRAMLYGAEGVPKQTSTHFTKATEGLAFVGGSATDILYKPGTCLRTNLTTCLTPGNPYYEYTVNGLDVLMQQYFRSINIMLNQTGMEPQLDSDVFKYIWQTRPDIIGGLDQLVAAYNQHLAQVYSYTLSLHIVAFVLTSLLLVGYLVFMWRPFLKETGAETKRVAELLSQVPPEVKVDELVIRSVFTRAHHLAAGVEGGANKSFTAMMRSQNSMASFKEDPNN